MAYRKANACFSERAKRQPWWRRSALLTAKRSSSRPITRTLGERNAHAATLRGEQVWFSTGDVAFDRKMNDALDRRLTELDSTSLQSCRRRHELRVVLQQLPEALQISVNCGGRRASKEIIVIVQSFVQHTFHPEMIQATWCRRVRRAHSTVPDALVTPFPEGPPARAILWADRNRPTGYRWLAEPHCVPSILLVLAELGHLV